MLPSVFPYLSVFLRSQVRADSDSQKPVHLFIVCAKSTENILKKVRVESLSTV